MLREADLFARCLRNVDSQLTRVENDVRGLGASMKDLLESPLPRPYIISETGEVMCETSEADIVGAGVQVERITTASQVLALRLNEEVHAPLREWLSAFDRAKHLLHEVEKLRVELDSRKRTVVTLEAKANTIRSKLDKGDGNQQRSFEDTEKKLRHKEEKCANCKEEFEQLEQECSSALRALLKDSSNLRDFLAQAYKVLHETSIEAYGGFTSAQAYPQYVPPQNVPETPPPEYGDAMVGGY